MTQAIGIRLPENFLKKVEGLSRRESEDRSAMIKKLLLSGYRDFIIRRAAQRYVEGMETLSGAAKEAEVTVWEMQQYLVRSGFKSEYSIEDLEKETKSLEMWRSRRSKQQARSLNDSRVTPDIK